VVDSAQQKGKVGNALKRTFRKPMRGLPQDEPLFDIKFVTPQKMNKVLRYAKNLIFVTILDDESQGGQMLLRNFTEESIEKIKNNPNLFMFIKQNDFAYGQEIVHLFGNNPKEMADNIMQNQARLLQHFVKIEKERLREELYESKERKGIEKNLLKKYEYMIRVPFGYEVAKEEDNFVWIRQYDREIDKSIFIIYKPYESTNVFQKENILEWRNDIGKNYIVDIEDPSIYVETQEIVPLITEEVNLNGRYAVKVKGLWRLSDLTRGGPFISYVVVDEKQGRVYYLEGYVDSPGQDKRATMWELDAILNTFKTAAELKQSEKGSSS